MISGFGTPLSKKNRKKHADRWTQTDTKPKMVVKVLLH